MEALLIFVIVFLIVLIVIGIVYLILRNPFKYSPYYIEIDISRRKNVDYNEEIEKYLLRDRLNKIVLHHQDFLSWQEKSQQKVAKSILKGWRTMQYQEILQASTRKEFVFRFVRSQTRYTQRNYVRTPYRVYQVSHEICCNYEDITKRYDRLAKIDFATTTKKYHAKNQRSLMTPELRRKIMIRDNYTCQKCGKYMPDEVGLQIDHIIPVSKGGRTVEPNLQVLCSKCNAAKSNK